MAIPRLTGARENAAKNTDLASLRTVESAVSIAIADGKMSIDSTGNAFAFPTGGAKTVEGALVPEYLKEYPTGQAITQKGSKPVVSVAANKIDVKWTALTPP